MESLVEPKQADNDGNDDDDDDATWCWWQWSWLTLACYCWPMSVSLEPWCRVEQMPRHRRRRRVLVNHHVSHVPHIRSFDVNHFIAIMITCWFTFICFLALVPINFIKKSTRPLCQGILSNRIKTSEPDVHNNCSINKKYFRSLCQRKLQKPPTCTPLW